jgi:hypothetical protein
MTKRNIKGRFSFAQALAYARYAIAGGIGGVAVYNTYVLISTAVPTQSLESISMAVGAVLSAALVKVLHVA